MKSYSLVIIISVAVTVSAQQQYVAHATPQKTAVDQIQFARRLHAQALQSTRRGTDEYRQKIADVLTNLELVPTSWPADRPAVIEAALFEAEVYEETHAYGNAVNVLARVEAIVRGRDDEAILWWRKALALDHLNRLAEAEDAYARAQASRFVTLDLFHRSVILHDAAFFHARQGQYLKASDELRQAAAIQQRASARVPYLMMSCEQNLNAGAAQRAREDLSQLDQLLPAAGAEPLTAVERSTLAQHAASVAGYHKRAGG